MFEVQDLKYATLATVSRCGMVWFSEDVLSTDMIFNHFLARLRSIPLDEGEDEMGRMRKGTEDEEETASPMLQVVGVHHSSAWFMIVVTRGQKGGIRLFKKFAHQVNSSRHAIKHLVTGHFYQ